MTKDFITTLPPWPRHDDVFTKYGVDTSLLCAEDKCLFTKGDKPVISKRDIHLVAARPKAGKSTFAWALAEAAIKGEALGFKAREEGLRVLILDSEMAEADVSRKCRTFECRTGTRINNLRTDSLRALRLRRPNKEDEIAESINAPEWRMQCLREALSAEDFDIVVLDGVADFCIDIMDNQESINTARELMQLAETHDCAIICILHLNTKGEARTRGALGSQLQRDASDFFLTERKKDAIGANYVEVEHQLESRHQQVSPTYFLFGEDGEAIEYNPVPTAQTEEETLRELLLEIFDGRDVMPTALLSEGIMSKMNVSLATAKRKIAKAVKKDFLTKIKQGEYGLTAIYDFKKEGVAYEDIS